MNIKTTFTALCLAFASLSVSAQNIAPNNFGMSTSLAFAEYYKHGGVHEKLYLVTDKPYYSAGDNIYFSAYLLNPVLFTPAVESSFLYVELISADGRLITRLKVLGEKGRFSNKMELSTKLDAGRYTLRAYSKWMSIDELAEFLAEGCAFIIRLADVQDEYRFVLFQNKTSLL